MEEQNDSFRKYLQSKKEIDNLNPLNEHNQKKRKLRSFKVFCVKPKLTNSLRTSSNDSSVMSKPNSKSYFKPAKMLSFQHVYEQTE